MSPFHAEQTLLALSDQHPTPERFREALRGISRRSREGVVRLWLTESIPYAFRERPIIYEEVRGWIGDRLKVCPKQVTIVGSARIGFSLAKKKFGRAFNEDSDLDLAIVSETLFRSVAETFTTWRQDYRSGAVRPRGEREEAFWQDNAEHGEHNMSAGFVDAKKIPTFNRYPLAQEIQTVMWALTVRLKNTAGIPSPSRASVRVYRTWADLVRQVSLTLRITFSS